jgi:magnesium transporter
MKEVEEPRTGVWVQVTNPTEEELASLVTAFSLHEDILKDATDMYEVPRLEREGNATYFFTRYPLRDQVPDNATAPLLIVVGESFVITIAVREVPQFRKLIAGEVPVYTTQKAKLFIEMMNILTKSFDQELVRLRKAVHRDRVHLQAIGPKEIEQLVGYESILNSIVDALMPTNSWLQQVPRGNYMQLYAEDIDAMEDLVIDNGQVVQSARSVLKTIQNIRGASEAIMTSRLNNALRILTGLTIILTVPLVITSLYGMNVPLPFAESAYAFYGILFCNIALLVGLTWLFRRNKWF